MTIGIWRQAVPGVPVSPNSIRIRGCGLQRAHRRTV